jgi:hypothetical protein
MTSLASNLGPANIKRQASRSLEERVAQEDDYSGVSLLKKTSSGGLQLFTEALDGSGNNPTFQNRKILKVNKRSSPFIVGGVNNSNDSVPRRMDSNNSLSDGLNLTLNESSFQTDSDGRDDSLTKQYSIDSNNNALLGAESLNLIDDFDSLLDRNPSMELFSNGNDNYDENKHKPLPRTTSTDSNPTLFRQESIDLWGNSGDNCDGEIYEDMIDPDEQMLERELSDNLSNINMLNPSPRNNNNVRQRRSFTDTLLERTGINRVLPSSWKVSASLKKSRSKSKGRGANSSYNNNNNKGSTSNSTANRRANRRRLESKNSTELKELHRNNQKQFRDNIKNLNIRLQNAVKLGIDVDKYKNDLGRMIKVDWYVGAISLLKDDTEEQAVACIQEKQMERESRQGISENVNRFKMLRSYEDNELKKIQDIVCDKSKKITKALTLQQASEFLERKFADS